jgi:hypothetical protein
MRAMKPRSMSWCSVGPVASRLGATASHPPRRAA